METLTNTGASKWQRVTQELHWRIACRWIAAVAFGLLLHFFKPSVSGMVVVSMLFLNRRRAEIPFPRTTIAALALLSVATLLMLLAIGISHRVPHAIQIAHVAVVLSGSAFAMLVVSSDIVMFS